MKKEIARRISSNKPSPENFLDRLMELADSQISDDEIFDHASEGTLHNLFQVPLSVFDETKHTPLFVSLEDSKPLTAVDLVGIAGRRTRAEQTLRPSIQDHTPKAARRSASELVTAQPQSNLFSVMRSFHKRAPSRYFRINLAMGHESRPL